MDYYPRKSLSKYLITDTIDFNKQVHVIDIKAKFKSPCNFEELPYVAARVFSPLVIHENVDDVHLLIEIYRIRITMV
jgi:hypothetical protein